MPLTRLKVKLVVSESVAVRLATKVPTATSSSTLTVEVEVPPVTVVDPVKLLATSASVSARL